MQKEEHPIAYEYEFTWFNPDRVRELGREGYHLVALIPAYGNTLGGIHQPNLIFERPVFESKYPLGTGVSDEREDKSHKGVLVVIEEGDHNYSAYSPDLPGCVATGSTEQEAFRNMAGAIELHMEGLRDERSATSESGEAAQ